MTHPRVTVQDTCRSAGNHVPVGQRSLGWLDTLCTTPTLARSSALAERPLMLRVPEPLGGAGIGRSGTSPADAGWEWPLLQLQRGGLIGGQVVLEAVALLPALLRAADNGLLGIGAVAEHDVEEVVVGPTDDVGV